VPAILTINISSSSQAADQLTTWKSTSEISNLLFAASMIGYYCLTIQSSLNGKCLFFDKLTGS